MTHAVTQREVLAHAPIVLHVPAELRLTVLDGRIANALRELRRQSGLERGEVRKLKSPESICRVVAFVSAGFQLHTKTNAVFFERVVDVVVELEFELTAAAAPLRAAVVESARHEDRL